MYLKKVCQKVPVLLVPVLKDVVKIVSVLLTLVLKGFVKIVPVLLTLVCQGDLSESSCTFNLFTCTSKISV